MNPLFNYARLGRLLFAALVLHLILTPSFAAESAAEQKIKSTRMITRDLDPHGKKEGLCMESISFFEYDQEGRLLCETKGDPVEEIVRYEYDDAGRLVKETREFPGAGANDVILGWLKTITYEYANADNNPVRETWVDFQEGKTSVVKKYDEQGRLVRTATSYVGADGATSEEDEVFAWSTDEQGNVTRRKEARSDWDWSIEKTWNPDGVLISEKTIEAGGDGPNTRDTHYLYDEQGNLVRQAVVYPGNSGFDVVLQFEYEFDPHGNWTEQTVCQTVGGGETLIIQVREREIVYW